MEQNRMTLFMKVARLVQAHLTWVQHVISFKQQGVASTWCAYWKLWQSVSCNKMRRKLFFSEGICTIHRCPRGHMRIVCRSMKCERDRAGISVYLRWINKEFFGKKVKLEHRYFYHSYVLHLITANIISNHHGAQPAIFSEQYFQSFMYNLWSAIPQVLLAGANLKLLC